MDTYERTYSQLLQVQLANDRAIAAALSVDEQPRPPPEADTSLDGQLALQLHEKEVEKLGELCSPRSRLVSASVLFHVGLSATQGRLARTVAAAVSSACSGCCTLMTSVLICGWGCCGALCSAASQEVSPQAQGVSLAVQLPQCDQGQCQHTPACTTATP
jgi:hypothetical protein